MNYKFNVICTECSDEHSIDDIKILNVEENMAGEDVCFFECPVTNEVTKSLVYGGL